jgi:hypothetical protein
MFYGFKSLGVIVSGTCPKLTLRKHKPGSLLGLELIHLNMAATLCLGSPLRLKQSTSQPRSRLVQLSIGKLNIELHPTTTCRTRYIRVERQEHYKQAIEQDRIAREQRLLSGADCKWTQIQQNWFCRANGRTYRLSPTKDKMWDLYRVKSVSTDNEGTLVGKYKHRGDATKVVKNVAYQPEPNW